ncbi:MAG: heavy metal translocating P-type ATPase, partial [Nitrospira sp.]|nr:heavy metal translocating P-type ATPase [Nitrospira sp.]
MIASALGLAITSEIIGWVSGNERGPLVIVTAIAAILLGGTKTFRKGLVAVRTLTLNINFLMSLAVVGALVIGSWPEAAMVTVLFGIAEMIEAYSLDRARNAVKALMQLAPELALIQSEGGWKEVSVDSVEIGSVLRVKPGERIALDGLVVNGQSSVNQAPITGESVPVDKTVGDALYAGTINEQGVLEFRVTNSRGHTTLDKIIKTVQEAQASRAPTQRFVEAFARIYTPVVVLLAVLIAVLPPVFGQPFAPWLYKALVLLVIACPCALVISTPVTVVTGLAAGARLGILIKGGAHLESGRRLSVIALDKTGTLTHGKPKVTDVIALHDSDRDHAMKLAASLDSLSDHPVAKAVVNAWQGELFPVTEFQSLTGRGVGGTIENEVYFLGNHRLTEEKNVCCDHVHDAIRSLEAEGKSTVVLADKSGAIAVFGVADTLKDESVEAVRELHALGVKAAMLTGDNEATARSIASKVGIDDVQSELLPEEKLAAVKSLQSTYGAIGMVGDGVNDAPALATATVGFAMGAAGTDTAIETADVALMDDDLRKIPVYIRLSRKTGRILTQNIAIALGIKVVFFALAFSGHATLWMAVFADM